MIDYKELCTRTGIEEIEFLKCEVDDAINQLLFPQDKYDVTNVLLVGTQRAQLNARKILQELNLPQFSKEAAPPQPLQSELPSLTGQEKTVSLLLMRPKPSITKLPQQLRGNAATSITNINVLTKPEVRALNVSAASTKKASKENKLMGGLHLRINRRKKNVISDNNVKPQGPPLQSTQTNNRRHSLVGDSLPAYIVQQLPQGRRDSEEEIERQHPEDVQAKTNRNHNSRIKSLVDTSKQMYARSNEVDTQDNGTTTEEIHIEDEDHEYILPQLLTRIYGEMNDSPINGGEDEEDYYAYSDEDNGDDVDFINLNGSLDTNRRTVTEGSDSEEYLF